jgi:polysaccharide chain length determinant protein (PEP-CTERM system associated)
LRRQLAGEAPTLVADAEEVLEIDSRIDALKRNLDTLLQRFTEQHPDVVGTRRVIAELEDQKRREAAARESTGGHRRATSSTANRVYQELRVSLATAEATTASLRTRVEEYERRYQQLKDAARMVPEVEAQLAQLNRDYEVNRKQYEALVTRRESAAISGDMESVSASGGFRIVDPPRVPTRPRGPGRLALMLMLLAVALGAGAAVSFAVTRVWPVFFDGQALRAATGLAVLGSVSLKMTDADRKRNRLRLIRFFSALAGLFVAHAAMMVLVLLLVVRAA